MKTARMLAILVLLLGLVGSVSAELVAYYEFEGDATDSVGNNHGTEVGNPTYEEGVLGRAISLDGSGDYVDCGYSAAFDITDEITLTFWIAPGGRQLPQSTILSKGNMSWKVAFGNGMYIEFLCMGLSSPYIVGSSDVLSGGWHHVAAVYDGSSVQLYMDGSLDATRSSGGRINTTQDPLWIGGGPVSDMCCEAYLDDVRIYNHALGPDDIGALSLGNCGELGTSTAGVEGRSFKGLAGRFLGHVEITNTHVHRSMIAGPALKVNYGGVLFNIAENKDAFVVTTYQAPERPVFRVNTEHEEAYFEHGIVGIGTKDPMATLHVLHRLPADWPSLILENPLGDNSVKLSSANASQTSLKLFESDDYGFEFLYSGSDDKLHLWSRKYYDNEAVRMTWLKTGDVGIGTTDPKGKLDVNGSIYQRGNQLHADYVFEPGYELESIEEHSEYMWQHKHLAAIPKAVVDDNGQEIVEVGAHRKGIVEELEKAHIYIEQLHKRVKALEERLVELEPGRDAGKE